MKKTLKGFTLIELGIVIFSLSVLTSIIVPNLQKYITEAQIATDVANAKIIYEACMLTVATDDDVYRSAYNAGSSKATPYYAVYDTDGNVVQYLRYGGVTKNTLTGEAAAKLPKDFSYEMNVITRCDGLDGAQLKSYKKLDDHYVSGVDCIYTWENVSDGGSESSKGSNLRKKTDGHQRFTVALSENMNMPIMGDTYEGGKYKTIPTSGTKVHKDRTYLKMRYIVHKYSATSGNMSGDEKSRVAYRWFVTYDVNDLSFHVMSGTGQGAEAGKTSGTIGVEGYYEIYPNPTAEYDITNDTGIKAK